MRGRRAKTGVAEQAWVLRHRALLARDSARTPPAPDAVRDTRAYLAWVQRYAQTPAQWSPEWRKLYEDGRELPRSKFRKRRDGEVWSWISYLLMCQQMGMSAAIEKAGLARAPFDLRTCRLGRNPSNYSDGKLPDLTLLTYLTRTVIGNGSTHVERNPLTGAERNMPTAFPLGIDETEVDRARRLYDALRKWQRDRRLLTE